MVEIIAYSQDTAEQYVLDLYGDEVIPIKYNIENIVNPDELNTSYSKQFDLPATKNNNKFFKAYYDVSTEGNFNPYKSVKVIIRVDSIEIFSGILQLYSVTHKGGVSSYTVSIFSSIVNLYDTIKDKSLNDLDFSSLTHYYTFDNIASCSDLSSINDINGVAIPGGILYYPWVNYGMVTDGSTAPGSPNGQILDRPSKMEDVFRPWIKLKYLWDKIIDSTPYTYSSTFLDDPEFNKIYMDVNWGEDYAPGHLEGVVGSNNYVWAVEGSINADFIPTTSFTNLIYQNENTDDNDLYDNTTGVFTAGSDNTLLKFDGRFRCNWHSANDEITVRIEHNSTHDLAPPSNTDYVLTPDLSSFSYSVSEDIMQDGIWLNNGETVQIKVKKSSGSHANCKLVHQIGSSPGATFARYFVKGGHVIDINTNLIYNHGEINQLDFIKDIVKRYNLVITVDDNNPDNLIIEPYSTWIDQGNTLDWSTKIDVEEHKIEVPDNYRVFNLADAQDGSDASLSRHEDLNRRVYGTHSKNNTEIELYTSYEYDFNEGIFSPTVYKPFSTAIHWASAAEIPSAEYYPFDHPTAQIYGDDFKKIKNKPRIAYYASTYAIDLPGLTGTSASPLGNLTTSSYGFNNTANNGGSVGTTNLTNSSGRIISVPTISPYYTSAVQLGTINSSLSLRDINYGSEVWLSNYSNGTPYNTVYRSYWHRYLSERYNKDTKIIKINANLDSADIYNLSFNDTILIKGQAYYLLSVEHYPNTTKLSKLELLKLSNDTSSAECSAVAEINAAGQVLDSSGSSLSNYCCNLYGYNFTNGSCYSNISFLAAEDTVNAELSNIMSAAAQAGNNNLANSGSNLLMGASNNMYQANMCIVAGSDNDMSNSFRSASIGTNNKVGQSNAMAIGKGAIADRPGELAHGFSSTRGRAQQSTLIFTGLTTNDLYTEIFIDGDSDQIFNLDLDKDVMIGIEANVIAQDTSTQDSMHKYQHTTFKVSSSVARQVGTTITNTNNKDSGVSGWTNQYIASASGDYIKVEVKGERSKNIEWTVILNINEMRL